MKNKTINAVTAALMISDAGGQIFGVTFRKRTGNKELRTLSCRRKVTKGVTGSGMAYKPSSRGLVTVYDMVAGHHKTIPADGLVGLRMGGVQYEIQN